ILLRTGYSLPVFGHFGDSKSGFEPNFSYGIGYLKDYDEFFSFGFISDENLYFKNRATDIKLKFFSFTPALFIKPDLKSLGYLYIASGIYHWTSPSSNIFSSTSDDEFGMRVGYARFFCLKKIRIGGGFEWNYIIGVKGKNFDLGNINTFVVYLSFKYDF
ncbi:MAG: hypothetical protein ACP5PA_05505, partial [Elusimicrobiales bacterium]